MKKVMVMMMVIGAVIAGGNFCVNRAEELKTEIINDEVSVAEAIVRSEVERLDEEEEVDYGYLEKNFDNGEYYVKYAIEAFRFDYERAYRPDYNMIYDWALIGRNRIIETVEISFNDGFAHIVYEY